MVFDLTNRQSFKNISKWVSKLRALGVQVPGCLIGNKDDINQDRQVITDKEASKLAQSLDLKYFKVFTNKIFFQEFNKFNKLI